jgi:hypothetical protein
MSKFSGRELLYKSLAFAANVDASLRLQTHPTVPPMFKDHVMTQRPISQTSQWIGQAKKK